VFGLGVLQRPGLPSMDLEAAPHEIAIGSILCYFMHSGGDPMQPAEKLSITLPADMVRTIRAKVQGGTYASNSEVIREAMRGWMERERHSASLEAAIDLGIAGMEAGQGKTTDEVRRSLLAGLATKDDQPAP
jgi:antitoxin ParD1/3/4